MLISFSRFWDKWCQHYDNNTKCRNQPAWWEDWDWGLVGIILFLFLFLYCSCHMAECCQSQCQHCPCYRNLLVAILIKNKWKIIVSTKHIAPS
jgi:hypothetical protein